MKENKYKTIFYIKYDHFEYLIMLFNLCNALAIFQFYINDALREFLDEFCIIYLDDVLIYTNDSLEDHINHRKAERGGGAYRLDPGQSLQVDGERICDLVFHFLRTTACPIREDDDLVFAKVRDGINRSARESPVTPRREDRVR